MDRVVLGEGIETGSDAHRVEHVKLYSRQRSLLNCHFHIPACNMGTLRKS
jgi:hypothetical protein